MSVESMAHVLNHSRAKGTAKVVLLGIANHDGDGGSWPSVETLMRYANADRRTVQRALRDLVDLGELVVHKQDGGTRSTRADRRPNRYTITVESTPENGAAQTPPRVVDGAAQVSPRGGAGVVDGAAQTPPEPSFNHPEPLTPKRARQIPDGFAPNDRHRKLAADLGVDLAAEFEQFEDHHIARGSTFKDWDRALNTWLRNARKFARPGAGGPMGSTTDQRVQAGMDLARRLAAREAEERRAIGGGR